MRSLFEAPAPEAARRWLRALAAACALMLGLVVASASPARAEGEPTPTGVQTISQPEPTGGFGAPGFELVDVSAWVLRAGELEVGPTAVRYGLFDVFQIGTRFSLNLFGALNGEVKWTIHDDERIGIAAEAGVIRFDPSLSGIDEAFSVWAFPVSLIASGRPSDAVRLHAAVEFLSARPDSEAPDEVKRVQRYLGPVGRLAARVGVEWRLSDSFALLAELETPFILHRASLRYEGEDDAFDFLRGTLSAQLVFGSFNARLGGGWGPSLLGRSGLFPVVELAFRIY